MKLVLASASPRRAEILRRAGLAFDVHPAHVDEARFAGEPAEDYVRRLAEAKARFAADQLTQTPEAKFVIGADTVVLAEGEILGKPADAGQARRMLRLLAGMTHEVHTGLAIFCIPSRQQAIHLETTRVTFATLSDSDIFEYVGTGEPFDKAGAYGIQGIAGRFVTRIEGCYFNVMGLPLARLWSSLRALGWVDSSFTGDAPK